MPSRALQKAKQLDSHLKLIIGLGGSVVAIVGALVAGFSFVAGQINSIIDGRVDEMEQHITTELKEQQLAVTRLELMTLMEHDPTNKAEIEKLARYYFLTLNGDQYLSSVFTHWAEEYGGDISVVVK